VGRRTSAERRIEADHGTINDNRETLRTNDKKLRIDRGAIESGAPPPDGEP
jgi:hypothetical protein